MTRPTTWHLARALGLNPDMEVLWASRYDEWATPDWLFDRLNAEFAFGLDAAAAAWNARCPSYLTSKEDALTVPSWRLYGMNDRVWLNPPYGRTVGKWVRKAAEQSDLGMTVVMLVLARIDTVWFHDTVWRRASEVRIIRGRVRFGHNNPLKGSKNGAPAPSIVVVFRPGQTGPPAFTTLVR